MFYYVLGSWLSLVSLWVPYIPFPLAWLGSTSHGTTFLFFFFLFHKHLPSIKLSRVELWLCSGKGASVCHGLNVNLFIIPIINNCGYSHIDIVINVDWLLARKHCLWTQILKIIIRDFKTLTNNLYHTAGSSLWAATVNSFISIFST